MSQVWEAWNKNMTDEFISSWINVLNESVIQWYNKSSPLFVCVGHKPHIFVNERHAICCGIALILQRASIAYGKDRPEQLGPKMYQDLGRTVGLMFCMCESLFSMGRSVVMYIGFYVAGSIVALGLKGVYSGSLVDKRLY